MRKPMFIALLLISSAILSIQAQNDVLFNQYMFSEISYNPAVVGSTPNIETALLSRMQWAGYNGAPLSQVLNAHGFVRNVGGIGMNIINDKLGNEGTLDAKLIYAHHIQANRTSFLSFGLAAGFISKKVNVEKLVFEDEDDAMALIAGERRFKPDFNFGIDFSSPHFSCGLASSHIHYSLNKATNFKVPRHYYAYAKGRIEIDNKYNIVPSVLVKSAAFITQFDINTLFYYENKYWIGASYRPQQAYVGILGFSITDEIKFGYAYDFALGPITANMSSHELFLSYAVKNKNARRNAMSPRFFD